LLTPQAFTQSRKKYFTGGGRSWVSVCYNSYVKLRWGARWDPLWCSSDMKGI
jgi:hypothetical protein